MKNLTKETRAVFNARQKGQLLWAPEQLSLEPTLPTNDNTAERTGYTGVFPGQQGRGGARCYTAALTLPHVACML